MAMLVPIAAATTAIATGPSSASGAAGPRVASNTPMPDATIAVR